MRALYGFSEPFVAEVIVASLKLGKSQWVTDVVTKHAHTQKEKSKHLCEKLLKLLLYFTGHES